MKKLIIFLLISFSISSYSSAKTGLWYFLYRHKMRLITLTIATVSVVAIARGHLSFLFESKEVTYRFGLQTRSKSYIASLNTK